jgi:hypothetical protein
MRRLPLVLSATALAVAVLGSTPLGNAVSEVTKRVGSAQLQRGSVTVTKIRDGHVTNPKLASGAVTTEKVRDGTLTAADLAAGVLPPPGIVEVVVRRAVQALNATGFKTQTVACEAGWKVLGGGGGYLAESGDTYATQPFYGSLLASGPVAGETNAPGETGTATGWSVTVLSSSATPKRLAAFVLCGR